MLLWHCKTEKSLLLDWVTVEWKWSRRGNCQDFNSWCQLLHWMSENPSLWCEWQNVLLWITLCFLRVTVINAGAAKIYLSSFFASIVPLWVAFSICEWVTVCQSVISDNDQWGQLPKSLSWPQLLHTGSFLTALITLFITALCNLHPLLTFTHPHPNHLEPQLQVHWRYQCSGR